jgi:hypothetical protein
MKFLYALGELTSDVVESIGTGIYRMGSSVFKAGQEANSAKVAGLFLFYYFSVIFQCGTLLVSFIVKGVFSVIGDVLSSVWFIIQGCFHLERRLCVKGFLIPFHSLNGHLLVLSGYVVVVFQKLFFIQKADRSLSENEADVLKDLFDDSIAMYNIRLVDDRCGIFGLSDRPFVLGNFIFMKGVRADHTQSVLVHECVHVWQYQQYGARYASEALYAQWSLRNAYDWRTEKEQSENWRNWNRESQAAFIEESWGTIRRIYAQHRVSGDHYVQTFLRESDDATAQFLFIKKVLRDIRRNTHNRFI